MASLFVWCRLKFNKIQVISLLIDSDWCSQDAFDVEGFCEMLSAYLPEFVNIDHGQVCEWIFELSSTLSQKKSKGKE